MELEKANEMMGIVNESLFKIKKVMSDVDTKRMHEEKAHPLYEGINFCYLEMLDMQVKLEEWALGRDTPNVQEASK